MNKKSLLAIYLFLNVLYIIKGQVYDWTSQIGGSNDVRSNSVIFDSSNNSYNVGFFKGTIDIDPGDSVLNFTSNGNKDIYVQKLNEAGDLIWAKQIGGSFEDEASSIVMDHVGNICITGFFQDTVDFDPGNGVFHLNSNGDFDVFILKLDSIGNLVLAGNIGGTSWDKGTDIAVDISNNIIVTGFFLGLSDFDPSNGVYNMNSQGAGGFNSFILKLNMNGNFIWAKKIGGNNQSWAYGLCSDLNGNIYSTGYFKGTADLDPSGNNYDVISIGDKDIYVQKLNSSGVFEWGVSAGGLGGDIGYDIIVDGNGYTYLTGYFNGIVDFDPSSDSLIINSIGGHDAFVWKLGLNGELDWAYNLGGSGFDRGDGITLDTSGNIYTTGIFVGTADMDPSINVVSHSSTDAYDVFLQKTDPSGQYLWSTSYGGIGWDVPTSVEVNVKGDIITAGYFENSADFDPSIGVDVLNAIGSEDAFIHKMILCSPSISVTACESYISPSGLHIWDSSGIYLDTVSYNTNCDSAISVILTILEATYDSITISSCDSFVAPSGAVFSAAGIYSDTITNYVGCDSIITYELTIISPSFDSVIVTSCDEYQAPSGNIYSTSGFYIDTISNHVGCDSIINIDLTILNSTNFSIDTSVCANYISPSGNYSWNITGTYHDTLTNSIGCDSIIQINLMIQGPNDSVISNNNILTAYADSAIYQWLDCDNNFEVIIGETNQSFSPSLNGNYAVEIQLNNCIDTSNCKTVILSEIDEIYSMPSIIVFPNPTRDLVKININGDNCQYKIELYDHSGRLLISTEASVLSLTPYSKGVYFIKIIQGNATSIARIINL